MKKEWRLVTDPNEALFDKNSVFVHFDFYPGLFMHSGNLKSGLYVCFEAADGHTGFMSLEVLAQNAIGIRKTTSIDSKAPKMTQLVQDAYLNGFIQEPIILEVANNDRRPTTSVGPNNILVVNG